MKTIKLLTGFMMALAFSTFVGCESEPDLYNGPDLVHFSTTKSQMVIKERDDNITTITLGSTTVSNTDRTYTISVVDEQTSAIEGVDFELSEKQVTIPAGEVITTFEVIGLYEGASSDGTTLTLTITNPSTGKLAGFNNTYTIDLFKFCSFNRDAFVGTYHVFEHSYWGEFEYNASSTTASVNSVIIDGFWEVAGSQVEVVFDAYGATCSVPDQFLFSSQDYGGRVHIVSYQNGNINSCNGTIEGLGFYIYGLDSDLLYDIVVVDMYMNTGNMITSYNQSEEHSEKPAQGIDQVMNN